MTNTTSGQVQLFFAILSIRTKSCQLRSVFCGIRYEFASPNCFKIYFFIKGLKSVYGIEQLCYPMHPLINLIGGVIVSVLASTAGDCGFDPRS